MTSAELNWAKFRFGWGARAQVYTMLQQLLSNGVPLNSALTRLSSAYREQNKRDARSTVLDQWVAGLARGLTFSKAISRWVPPTELMLVQSGEKAENIQDAFKNVIRSNEAFGQMRTGLIGGLTYPAILLMLLIGVFAFLGFKLIPELLSAVPAGDLGPSGQQLKMVADLVANGWPYLLAGAVGLVVLISWAMPRWVGDVRASVDSIPPFSIYKTVQGAGFLVSLSALMRSGMPMADAVESTRRGADPYLASFLDKVQNRLNAGMSPGRALALDLFWPDTAIAISIYGDLRAKDFVESIDIIGSAAIEDGVKRVKSIASMVNVMVLMMISMTVVWLFISIFGMSSGLAPTSNF